MRTRRDAGSPAQRLLTAAAKLFPREGIRAVGVDRLIAEADVARASLYQSFGSKDYLIAAYLNQQDELDRAAWQRASATSEDPVDKILVLFDRAATSARKRRYLGCLYLNAATEFPDRDHPAAKAIADHREWLHELLTGLLREADVDAADETAHAVQLLYDGALAGSKLERSTRPILLAREMTERLISERARSSVDHCGR